MRFTTEQARAISEIFEEHHTQMATRDDMKIIREELKNTVTKDELKAMREDFKMMREDFKYMVTKNELNAGIAKAKYDLVRWIVGAVISSHYEWIDCDTFEILWVTIYLQKITTPKRFTKKA